MRRPSLGWLAVPLLLGLWAAVSSRYPAYLFPGPVDVWREAGRELASSALYLNLGISLFRLGVGFAAATVLGLAAGLVTGLSPAAREFAAPVVAFFQAIPPIVWTPLLILFLGFGTLPMIVVIFYASFFPVLINVEQGVARLPLPQIRAARALGARGWRLLRHFYLPALVPALLAGLRIAFGIAWRSLVAAEMIGGSAGLGANIALAGQVGNAVAILFGILVIGSLALMMERLVFLRLEQRYSYPG